MNVRLAETKPPEVPEPNAPVVTADAARRAASRFAIMELSTQILAGEPSPRDGDRPSWSVPLILTSPARGHVGQVGEVLIDARTGEVLADDGVIARIAADAELLARRSPL